MSSAVPMTRLGGRAFNHSPNSDAEAEYDRLRDLARQEAGKMSSCFDRAHQAHEHGDGAGAKALSNEGKQHQAQRDAYNKQASEYIFRENNAPGHVAEDTIDLHGQFVEEAERILEARIRDAQARSQSHLHVIVGKGHHSVGHVQKIKPAVERLCQELGLDCATEENEGRIYVDLTGRRVNVPPPLPPQPIGHHGGYHTGGQGGYHQQPAHQYGGQQQQQQQQQASGSDSNDMTIGGMELALVGLCVSVLAIHLGLLLFHGARRRDAQGSPPAAAHHARLSEPCLWREVFPAQPDHELVLAYQQPEAYVDDQAAFVQQVRKRSGSVAGAIKHELSEVQRQKSALASSTAAYPAKILGTEEAENGAKRPTELGDEEALKRVRFGGVIDEPDAKKRSSWLIKLDEGTELKP
ncbi:hypothetical protein P8C59_000359 [Phyllachora maydis]|uniref:Smr domain-containing protein n=1 Tax=Phyllachora maydis TaxID=1825666 RepID=A0AAD9HVW4_9PEZI|nr:hypothetical protein P8C59_000359 [Phyllachora maydis]